MPLASSVLTVAPTSFVITREELKQHLRYIGDDENDRLDAVIQAAQQALEGKTRRAFTAQTWRGYYRDVCVGRQEVCPNGSTSSISVERMTADNTWTATTANMGEGSPQFWYPPSGLSTYLPTDGRPNWRVTATCTWTNPPEAIKQATLLMAAHLFTTETPVNIGNMVSEIPLTIDLLIAPYVCHLEML